LVFHCYFIWSAIRSFMCVAICQDRFHKKTISQHKTENMNGICHESPRTKGYKQL
jgi:hypothetical protein